MNADYQRKGQKKDKHFLYFHHFGFLNLGKIIKDTKLQNKK